MDPPAHDRLRRLATSHFEQTEAVRPDMVRTASGLIDNMRAKHQIDLVDDFAYPLPVTVICQQLGVPHEDEPRFHPWAEAIITTLDPRPGQESAAAQASAEMNQYMAELVERYRSEPGAGLLSGLAAEEGMSTQDVVATGRLLLIAGHETTVNLITNGMLTLLRHPDILERLRHEQELAIPLVEELLRYEPPVQINPKYMALDDVEVGDVTIPKGSRIVLALAAANRDPNRFPDPDRFDPEREDNEHLGFFTGIHYCFGAGLARQEAQVALTELACRLENPGSCKTRPRTGRIPRCAGLDISRSRSTGSASWRCARRALRQGEQHGWWVYRQKLRVWSWVDRPWSTCTPLWGWECAGSVVQRLVNKTPLIVTAGTSDGPCRTSTAC
jgi:cytochrome P450